MTDKQDLNPDFIAYKQAYGDTLTKFLNHPADAEKYLNEGYKLGRLAIEKDLGLLNVAAIHHDCLIEYLESSEINLHLERAENASAFLEEILASFQMTDTSFRQAINMLNLRSLEYASRANDRKMAVMALQESLKEKEVLLKEVYHRVKNNLQVVASLLNLQADTTEIGGIKDALIESSSRVKSMSLIHEMLYQSENLSKINMENYINNLFKYLFKIYDVDTNRVKLLSNIENVTLTIDTAIPCGLIINEIISNSLKYAFPQNRSGEISISFKKNGDNIVAILSDDGAGIPADVDINQTTSLGMRLINSLTKQLGGTIVLDAKRREFTLNFPDLLAHKR